MLASFGMEPQCEPPTSGDPEFPSGPWTGYWVAGGCRFRQDLDLKFAERRLRGGGIDAVGRFEIEGRYDPEAREVVWTKQYLGAHEAVEYRGFREGRGIWGTWDSAGRKGGFQIWPREEPGRERRPSREEIELMRALEEIVPGIVYG